MASAEQLSLLHGTSSKLWVEIQSSGLKNPCLTSDLDVANYFAQEAAELDGGLPIILHVLVDSDQLVVDWPAYEEPLTLYRDQWADSDEEWEEGIDEGSIPYPDNNQDWITALEVTTCVKAIGNISKERIRF